MRIALLVVVTILLPIIPARGQVARKSLADHFASNLASRGIDEAVAEFNSTKKSDEYEFSEREMNDLGYRLMAEKQIAAATACFRLIVQSQPQSANAYDSLAEAYLLAGETERAIANYSRSVELNPNNGAARAIVWRLKKETRRTKTVARGLDKQQLTVAVNAAAARVIREDNLVGAAVVVVQNGKTIFKNGYGVANARTQAKVDPDETIFRIGSISKALTLLTLTRLVDQGRVRMHDNVEKFYGPIPNPGGLRKPITIGNLMTHTTGLDQIGIGRQIRQFNLPMSDRLSRRPTIERFLRNNNIRRVSEPGAFYRYDTYGTTLAGFVVGKVAGKPYREAMRTEIFERLGMKNTFVEAAPERSAAVATGYERYNGQNIPQPYELYLTTPASSIDSTAADMGRLLEALTSDGANSHGRFLSPRMTKAVLAPQYRPHPEFPGTTHGLHESYDASGDFAVPIRSVDHGGTMAGFKSLLTILPDYKLGVYIVTNTSGGGRNPLAAAVMKAIVGQLPDRPQRKPFPIPKRDPNRDLSEFVGTYSYAMYCHSCSPAEFAQGGWQPGRPATVLARDGLLSVRDRTFVPAGGDIFVRDDGRQRIYFGRDARGAVRFFTYSTSNDAFERVAQ